MQILFIGCNESPEHQSINMSSGFEEKVLRHIKFPEGTTKLITRTAIVGGEDSYLKSEEFDEKGNSVKEYGYRPYGFKYKMVRTYDDTLLIKEVEYIYSFQDSSYKYLEFYTPEDTLISFPELATYSSHTRLKSYHPNLVLKQEINISPKPKNAIECDEVERKYINNFNTEGKKISEYVVFENDTTNWQIWEYINDSLIAQTKWNVIYEDCGIPKDTIIDKIKS